MNHSVTFEKQTKQVVQALFSDPEEGENICFRNLDTDYAGEEEQEDDFDPYVVSSRLRAVGDQLDEDIRSQAKQFVEEPVNLTQRFSNVVNSLSSTWVARNPDLTNEKAVLKVAVSLALCVFKMEPSMQEVMQSTLTALLTSPSLLSFIEEQGGWMHIEI
ncbi:bcl-2-like protein 15 [Lissotriton helveticus]